MDFSQMTLPDRASHCLNIYLEKEGAVPKCCDSYNENRECGSICCGYCPDYRNCRRGKCRQVWIDPHKIMDDPRGRLCYVVLETGQLIAGSVPCLISEMYDDNG